MQVADPRIDNQPLCIFSRFFPPRNTIMLAHLIQFNHGDHATFQERAQVANNVSDWRPKFCPCRE